MHFDGVMILGKELRRNRERALAELRARAAGAAIALRNGATEVAALEAPLVGQEEAGSIIVARFLRELGVDDSQMILAQVTRSTREEAVEGARVAREQGWSRMLVVTAAYHVERARKQFEEVLGADRVAVFAPESLLQHANGLERQWILEGKAGDTAHAEERMVEVLFSVFALGLRVLPPKVRWDVEIWAGAKFRGMTDAQ